MRSSSGRGECTMMPSTRPLAASRLKIARLLIEIIVDGDADENVGFFLFQTGRHAAHEFRKMPAARTAHDDADGARPAVASLTALAFGR